MSGRKFSESLSVIAAKSCRSDKTRWLPFVVHAIDTTGIIEKLFNKWLPEHVRNELSTTAEFPKLIALLHDTGKITPAFQNKIAYNIEGQAELLHSNGLEITKTDDPSKSPHQVAGQAILEEYGFPREISVIVGSHHGKGDIEKAQNQIKIYEYNYFGYKCRQEKQWRSIWDEWISYSLNKTGFTLDTLPKPDVKSQMILTGLLIMADWIASNTDYFPYISIGDKFENIDTQRRIDEAWEKLNLPKVLELETCCNNPDVFEQRFLFSANSVQERIMEIASQNTMPGLYILEAPMGLGKTEAALSAAEILIDKFGSGGIYFGLPTQATANGIFSRIKAWASKCDTETHSIRLAHGMTELNKEYKSMFSGKASDSGDDNIIIHEWFEGRKQALLSDFVIATIDQFLLASLKQKHVMLRHLGLAGKVVILDECHAYDSYMNIYLDHTLTWMGAYNVPVIVLSATLPPRRRDEMIKAYLNLRKEPEIQNKADPMSYPVLTYASKNLIMQEALPCDIPEKNITVQWLEEESLISHLREKLSDGGCAAIIVNTVAYAQSLSKMLKTEMKDFEVICFHSRFIATDRANIEETLLKRVGKSSTSEIRNKLIVVGTQVIEQSLDLDFDTMITELCPMDLLLQRSGRLHRHNSRIRPNSCNKPVLAILKPSDEKRNNIYSEWILEQTAKYLPETLDMPSCIPFLVSKVYEEPVEKTENYKKYQYEIAQKEHNAEKFCIRSNKLGTSSNTLLPQFIDDEAGNSSEAEASVRDTEDTIEVLVLMKDKELESNYRLVSGKYTFNMTMDISENEALSIAHERLRLPLTFSQSHNWEKFRKASNFMPERWNEMKLLNGEFLLLLDYDMEAELIGKKLRYSNEFGLEEIKEEE